MSRLAVCLALLGLSFAGARGQGEGNPRQAKLRAIVNRLEARLKEEPSGGLTRERLIRLLLVELDSPAEAAAHVTADCGEAVRTYVPLVAKPPADLAPQAAVELGDWMASLAERASPEGKRHAFQRAKACYVSALASTKEADEFHGRAAKGLAAVRQRLGERAGPTAEVADGQVPWDPACLLVPDSPAVEGVRKWTIETRAPRGEVTCILAGPADAYIAVGDAAGGVRILDPADGKLRRVLVGHSDGLAALGSDPDANTLLAVCRDGAVHVWRPASGKLLRRIATDTDALSAAVSPDGRQVAFGCGGGVVTRWNLAAAQRLGELKGLKEDIVAMSWAGNGACLAAADAAGRTVVWDAVTGRMATDVALKVQRVGDVALSPDGTRLAVSDNQKGGVYVWDLAGNKLVRRLASKAMDSWSVAWSSDGKRLVSNCNVWAMPEGKPLGHGWWGGRVVWAKDNRTLLYGPAPGSLEGVKTRPLEGGGGWRSHPSGRRWDEAHWSTDLGSLFARPHDGKAPPGVWTMADGRRSLVLPAIGKDCFGWTPDGQALLSEEHRNGVRNVTLWDARTGRLVKELAIPGNRDSHHIGSVACSPDGKLLAAAIRYTRDEPCVVNIHTGKVVGQLESNDDVAWGVGMAWSPDGRKLAMLGGWGHVVLWAVRTGKMVRFKGPGGLFRNERSIAWSPDSRRVLTGSEEFGPLVWDFRPGRPARTVPGGSGLVPAVAWAEAGGRLAAMACTPGRPGRVRVYNDRSLKPVAALQALPGPGLAVRFSPDGRRVAGATRSGARVWDAGTGEVLLTFVPTTPGGDGVAVSGGGHYAAAPAAEAEKNLVVVVRTDAGSEALSPAEFAARFGWKNVPGKAGFGP